MPIGFDLVPHEDICLLLGTTKTIILLFIKLVLNKKKNKSTTSEEASGQLWAIEVNRISNEWDDFILLVHCNKLPMTSCYSWNFSAGHQVGLGDQCQGIFLALQGMNHSFQSIFGTFHRTKNEMIFRWSEYQGG